MKPIRRRLLFAAVATPWLAACTTPASPNRSAITSEDHWTGRMALRVDSNPPQSFAAMFELRGAAGRGELKLSTPIGSTLGLVRWSPDEATLHDGARVQRFDSVDLLLTHITGAALPVDALFDWLRARPTEVPGWRLQLAQVHDGRLQATRESPGPTAELRLVFEPAPPLRSTP